MIFNGLVDRFVKERQSATCQHELAILLICEMLGL